MLEQSKEDFVQLVRRFGDYVTIKMSSIFSLCVHDLDSRSVGTVAGLAVAVYFTWRFLRTSGCRRTRSHPPKPRHSLSPTDTATASDSVSFSEDSKAQDIADELFHHSKPSLSLSVRQKLNNSRKVTCSLLGVILHQTAPEQLQGGISVRSSVVEVLLEIAKFSDVYLMERVLNDETENEIISALEEAGVFGSGGLIRDKILFCSTELGRASFVRQLEPDWHIDTDPDIIYQLSRFIKYQLLISTAVRPEQAHTNVFTSHSLEQFFGCMP